MRAAASSACRSAAMVWRPPPVRRRVAPPDLCPVVPARLRLGSDSLEDVQPPKDVVGECRDDGVRRTTANELAQWRYHGRLVARQLDDAHVVIRADFDYRASVLRQFPGNLRCADPVPQAPDGRR